MTKRFHTLILLACAAIGVACGSDSVFEPVSATLEVAPTGATVLQGGSSTFAATLTRSGGSAGVVNVAVGGAPIGVTAVVSNVQTTGLVTTASVTLNVSGSTIPGAFDLVVLGTGPGIEPATTVFRLTVDIASCPSGGVCGQWATSASASSEYTPTDWGANQATGQPNAPGCEDDGRAWASLEANGVDWLELGFDVSVRPTEIRIHEVLGVSSIVKVEVKDGAGTYNTVYTAVPAIRTCPRVLTIPVAGITAMVKVIRVSLDQRALNAWNEIDAVRLIGQP